MADLQGGSQQVGGDTPHDAADSGNPLKTGGRARSAAITAVASDDRVDQVMSTTGGAQVAGQDGGVPRDVAVNASGQVEVDIAAQQAGALDVEGNVAHDAADSGNPVGVGFNAAEYKADPPQVSADGDRVRGVATGHGIQFVLGGHPNIFVREYMTTAAQTNDDIVLAVVGSFVVVTQIAVTVDAATTVTPQVRIGFGTASVPAEPASGASVVGVVLSHPGIAAGSGVVMGNGSGIIGIGADGEDLRITNTVPTGGQITVVVTYYLPTL